ncbi:hypothetical protein SLS62_001720 [Diatrype stigma]|uniref:Uncharacterized protein n=1 Tax=Diatrype stigma TaxID=117547 RepID=A0AAN9V9R0_9PEZI
MTTPIPTCRGFTNPAIVLVRNSLLQTSVPHSLGYTTTTTARTVRLAWNNRRNLATGRPLGAAAQPSNKGKNSKAGPTPPRAPKPPPPAPARAPAPASAPAPVARASAPSPKPTTRPTTGTTTAAPAAATAGALPLHAEPGSVGYARSLARKSTPTTLYEAAPQRMFLVSSYTAGLFTVLSGGINVWFNVYNVPEGTHALIPWAFGAVGAVMAAFGTRFAMTPSGVIRSISVLPAASSAPASGAGTTAAAPAAAKPKASTAAAAATPTSTSTSTPATAAANSPVLLEIRARRTTPFPFLPLKRMVVEPHQVVMKARLYNKRPTAPPHETAAEERRRRQAAQQYERDHLMTAPFRHGAWAAGTVLAALRRGLTGEGFAPVEVGRTRYKLDITAGYALEDGRALDRIVRVEEDPRIAAARRG